LIAGEVALTVVLLAAAGLLIRTLIHLETIPQGFKATGVITAKASLDDVRYHDPAAFRELLRQSVTAMRVTRLVAGRHHRVDLTLGGIVFGSRASTPGAAEFSWSCPYRRRIVNTLPQTWIMNLRTITDVVWFVVPVLLVIIASCLSLW
jgi:hypothetical protein